MCSITFFSLTLRTFRFFSGVSNASELIEEGGAQDGTEQAVLQACAEGTSLRLQILVFTHIAYTIDKSAGLAIA